uniref:Probable magnesium transporter n=1 Tax=Leersia perrieri TaxID=77586 RepID=A0A0D9W3Z4_9ORYZ
MVMSIDNVRGFALATSSSAFIGSSFVIKKIGLKKAGDAGVRAGSGGYSYLYEPLWWIGMTAIGIVLHAPKEKKIDSVNEIWHLATQPGFIVYSCMAVIVALVLIFWVVHRTEQRKMLAYIAICSLMGSLTVISVKAVAIALKLSFNGVNQFIYVPTWFFIVVVIICCLVQLNYLNKALDSFNTAVVSPVYYVMFTILTILANMIMYKDWASQNATQIATELCGFVTIVAGTFLLHKTRDMGNTQSESSSLRGDCELENH